MICIVLQIGAQSVHVSKRLGLVRQFSAGAFPEQEVEVLDKSLVRFVILGRFPNRRLGGRSGIPSFFMSRKMSERSQLIVV